MSWTKRDLIQPKYIGYIDNEFWDYGELLQSPSPWPHDEPVALYPQQISERMRAQRGWFTMFGNRTEPLEEQIPKAVARIDLVDEAIPAAREFLAMAGLRSYSIFPDLDHLGAELVEFYENLRVDAPAPAPDTMRKRKRGRRKA